MDGLLRKGLGRRLIGGLALLPVVWLALYIVFAIFQNQCDMLYDFYGVLGKGCADRIYNRPFGYKPPSPILKAGWATAICYLGFVIYSTARYAKKR